MKTGFVFKKRIAISTGLILAYTAISLSISLNTAHAGTNSSSKPALKSVKPGASIAPSTALVPLKAKKSPDFLITKSRKLAFNFQNIDVRALLQLIGKESGYNFVVSDDVKGKVSLNLKDVTWQEALSIVLKTQGLASRKIGNVMYLSTLEDITATETKRLQSEETLANLAPVKSTIIALKYSNAADLAKLLKGDGSNLLTPRGEVAVDSRTNTLIVRDIATNLKQIKDAVKSLDIPAKQVLIEARIVKIDTNYEEQIGVRFGVSDSRHLSGTLAGANQINQGVGPANVDPITDRLNFNVPAAALFNGATPGSIALALQNLGRFLIDLELSALEGESHAQVISRPRVVTSNQQTASIQTGEEIPYQEATSSGATSVTFKKAVLSLEITPQITPNNKIILKLKATQDTRGTNTNVGGNQTVPAINTQAVQSNILLNNQETVVIGGIYKITKTDALDRIPFFGTLPMIGHLFSHSQEKSVKEELLIFITPKIITQNNHKAKPVMAVSKSGHRFSMDKELKK